MLRKHQLLISHQESPKVGRLQFRDSSELKNPDLKFLLHCKPKWHNNANRLELVLAKALLNVH
jgi:hypothetical protein